jgi:soluble lytic murein transglycosylase-like protein
VRLATQFPNAAKSMRNFILIMFLAVASSSAVAANPQSQVEVASAFKSEREEIEWLSTMSKRVESQISDNDARLDFLKVVLHESNRAGLNPQLVLSVIDVASGFKKYAVSTKGARGYMQVAPYWLKTIGTPDANLFHLRTNIRYGCTLLRYFIDFEKGDLVKGLGRYKKQMGEASETNNKLVGIPDFPEKVDRLSKTRWRYDGLLE